MSKSFIRGSNIDFFPSLIKERKFIPNFCQSHKAKGIKERGQFVLRKEGKKK